MGRQLWQNVEQDLQLANGTNKTATTIEDLWTGSQYTPIYANCPKAGKIFTVKAGGLLFNPSAGTLIITPLYGGSAGAALGASITQNVPITNAPWHLEFNLIFRTIGAPGANSTCVGTGFMTIAGSSATAGSIQFINFGGTVATVDATVDKDITIRKTLSVAATSFFTYYAYVIARN